MEQRKSNTNDKGTAQAGERPVRPNTDVVFDGGLSRSSVESSVMEVERRAEVVQLELHVATSGDRGMTSITPTKGIPITKEMVYAAYKKVKSNKGASGIDKESLEDFDAKRSKNLYKIWNRMTSGSYFPMGVREVSIPKGDGKQRKFGYSHG
jgi:RNA-directed DNA polymerase